MYVALVNTNRIKPAIAPIGLEYVAEMLNASGHRVEMLDLCWADDWRSAVAGFFDRTSPGLVGLTLRNTDDCAFTSRQSFLGEFADMVSAVREHTDALIVLGGVGFSVMPERVLELCQADAGVWGEGELALVELADSLDEGEDWLDVPNLVLRREGQWYRNLPTTFPLAYLPSMTRSWVDNRRYFREGGQAGIETKRGCPRPCIYCADPVAKGRQTRTRPPEAVADELEALLAQGIDHVHTCDSEFNLPEQHALEVCREIVRRGLGDRLRWYAYCSPVPFSAELARLMRRAGCAGINFGVDSGDEGMLRRLRRGFTPDDVLDVARFCREAGIPVMFDLLLGAPGESRDSLVNTIELMKRSGVERVGVALGVRVYPGTELADRLRRVGATHASPPKVPGTSEVPGTSVAEFFLEPAVAPFVVELLDELIGDDERFLFFDPSRPTKNYNYNANQVLVEAIRQGYRGAYWDILRRYGPQQREL